MSHRLTIDERRVMRAFRPNTLRHNPPRSYEEVTASVSLSVAMPSLGTLMSAGYITALEEGYVVTGSGFDLLDELERSRLD